MVKPCPGCGVVPVPEARFCRLCGGPLSGGTHYQNDVPISPLAQTMPLTGEGRATNGLSSDELRPRSSDTSKVGRKEIESILRRVQAEHGDDHRSETPTDSASENAAHQTTTLVSEPVASAQSFESPPSAPPVPVQSAQASPNARTRRMWQVAAVVLLFVALVAGGLAFILSRRATSENGNAPPISISDQKQLAGEKLAEAQTLLAAGEFNHAVDVLRVAVKLDPANADAHMQLGNALEKSGSRGEAIEEYRAAAQRDPNSVAVWRALASAQVEEKLYSDAAESYRRLLVANGNSLDDQTLLAYADALRLAGRTDEARSAYQKLSGSNSAEVARAARNHLSDLGAPAVAANGEQPRDARAETDKKAVPNTSPTPGQVASPTPAPTKVGPQIDYDAYYFQALNIVNGRDPRQIERADLLRALGLFQRAAQGGSHRAEAQGYVNRLGREYDRRKKW